MIKCTLLALFTISTFFTKAQTTCAQLRDKTAAITGAISLYQKNASPSASDLQQFKTAYSAFRTDAVNAAAMEKDYDIQLLLQVMAIQAASHYISALQNKNSYDEAWVEAQFIYEKVLLRSKYQQLARKDNWVACHINGENKRILIHENNYNANCTDFIGTACITALHLNKVQAATSMFAVTGFKGMLVEKPAIRRVAADIMERRLNNGITDDTTFLAAWKYLDWNNATRSVADVMSEYSNSSTVKALRIVTNPLLADRIDLAPLNTMDGFKNVWDRYACLYTTLAADTGFKYSAKFEIMKMGVERYLQMLNSKKLKDYAFFPYLVCMYQSFDRDYQESGVNYSVNKPMQDILNNGNKELLNGLAQVYEIYAKHCVIFPVVEKAHHYYSAYLCYRAIGENKKANKAFGNIPKVMLVSKTTAGLGYKKME